MNPFIKEQLQGKKVLLAAIPSEGHFNPLTSLAKYLQEAGCDVRWYTSEIFAQKLQKLAIPHFPFVHAMDVNSQNLDQLFPERLLINDPLARVNFDIINGLGKRCNEFYADIQEIQKSFPFELFICDSMFPATPLIKYKMNIPVVAIGVLPLAEESVDVPPYGMALLPAVNEEEMVQHAELRGLVNEVFFKESIAYYDAVMQENGLSIAKSMLTNLLIKEADLYLQIGTPGFEYFRSDLGANVHFIGALFPYVAQKERVLWFDERLKQYQKVLLVTQGTVEKDVKKIIEPTLEAFKDTDVLVIATTGGSGTAALKEKYAGENFIIEDFIPFEDIMPYANALITNGGYGGTLLGIKHKLPVIAAGVHEGKNEICARIGYFNCGINLHTETPSAGEIKNAAEEIIANDLYKNNVLKLSEEINSYDSTALIAQHITELLAR